MESHSALGVAVLGEELTLGEGIRPPLARGIEFIEAKALRYFKGGPGI